MTNKKGISGVLPLVIIGFMALGVAGYFIFGGSSPEVAPPADVQAATVEVAPESSGTESFISFESSSPYVSIGSGGVFYRAYAAGKPPASGVAPSTANAPKKIPGADPKTFSEIGTVKKTSDNSGFGNQSESIQFTYYRDNDQVFASQTTVNEDGDADTSVSSVVTADPATFQILNDTYAKDANHVYLVEYICTGTCELVLTVIVGADPNSFHVIEETVIQQSDGSGTVTGDAIDNTHIFNNGQVVDTVVTPGSDEADMTPVLISP